MFSHSTALTRATVMARPNRFIVEARLENGEEVRAHCPVSGRIGGLTLDNLPILISGPYENRGTTHTVEAFAMEDEASSTFQWIGINQSRGNAVVEHFLKRGVLSEAFPAANESTVRREKKLLSSRIDFLIDGKTFLEVKTPLLSIHAHRPLSVPIKDFGAGSPSDRLPKQLADMSAAIQEGYEGAMVVVFQYSNTAGTTWKDQLESNIFPSDLQLAREAGLKIWGLELSFTETGIDFVSLREA